MNPLINILIRVSRPEQYKVCGQSIFNQTYGNWQIITHEDDKRNVYPFHYNLFCNKLKAEVEDGFFVFVDDDDTLADENVLLNISKYLTDPDTAIICQFLRGDRPKPSDSLMDDGSIVRGKIGLPCIFLHHSKKHIADFVATEDADYRFIKEVASKMKVKFIKQVVVSSPKRSFGKCPASPYKIGDIIEGDEHGSFILTKTKHWNSEWADYEDCENSFPIGVAETYPALFKKLEWWEERKPEDMPLFVKDAYIPASSEYHKVYKASYDIADNTIFLNGCPLTFYGKIHQLIPATEEEYLSQNPGQKP